MDDLLSYLGRFCPLSVEFKQRLSEVVIPVSFPARHVLVEVPNISTHAYFLRNGFAITYAYDREGTVTENFWKAGEVMLAFESLVYQRPSKVVLQLLVASDLYCLSYESMVTVLGKLPEAYNIWFALMNSHYLRLERRIRLLKGSDHVGQYRDLLQAFPGIERIVTQRSIATYLGVTPQTLVRLKRNL